MLEQIIIYWLIAQVLGLVGLPLARLVLAGLPDRGWASAKPLGLMLSGFLAWMLAMLGLAPFGTVLIIGCAIGVLAIGLFSHPEGHPLAIWAWIRQHWQLVLANELLFLLALLFLANQRSFEWGFVGPNPWGTERPMDFAFFNAIQRSESFPPHDPWMSGFTINYYYFGYLLMGCVAMLSGLPAGVTYNLSLALIFATTAQGVAGLVSNLIGLTRGRIGRSGAAAALLGAVLVLVAGNQGGSLQLISGSHMILALDGPDMARALANGLGPRETITIDPPFRGYDFDGTSSITPIDTSKDFNWWNPSRALWDSFPMESGPRDRRYTITEFPFFSFWLGDMHPHVMSLPFCLLALTLALGVVARPTPPRYGYGRLGWLELLVVGICLGGLYTINSWDLPSYLLIFLAALLLRWAREPGTGWGAIDWRGFAMQAIPIVIAAGVLFLPFHLTFRSLVGGKDPLIDLPLISSLTRTIGIVYWSKTALHTFLIIFGLFLVPIIAWALQQLQAPRGWPAAWIVIVITLILGTIAGFPLLALAPMAVYSFLAALQASRTGRSAEAFGLIAFAITSLIAFGTEIIYIRDVFENRMNTIFKFYYQLWLIWGALASYALWALWQHTQAPQPATGDTPIDDNPNQGGEGSLPLPTASPRNRPIGALIASILFVPLLAGAAVYPWQTLSRLYGEGVQIGLNGTTPRERNPDGAAAIAWLRQNAPGNAVILEAVEDTPVYSYDTVGLGISGVSSSTGLATIMGWTGHQQQWRGGDPKTYAQIEPRRQDVATIYSTLDPAQAQSLLSKYQVRFVYVGPTERAKYAPEALAKFNQIAQPVFQQGDTTIYQVGG